MTTTPDDYLLSQTHFQDDDMSFTGMMEDIMLRVQYEAYLKDSKNPLISFEQWKDEFSQ